MKGTINNGALFKAVGFTALEECKTEVQLPLGTGKGVLPTLLPCSTVHATFPFRS